MIGILSISEKRAPVYIRERFAFSRKAQGEILRELCQGGEVQEAVILNTCNRMELYGYAPEGNIYRLFSQMQRACLKRALGEVVPKVWESCLFYTGRKASQHFFKVCAGLDSMVVGEDQILGQVKEAHQFAREEGFSGPVLNTLFREGITMAKKIKTRTLLSKTGVSVANLALKAASRALGGLSGRNILIIGASGDTGNLVLKNAFSYGPREIFVTKRQHRLQMLPSERFPFTQVDYGDRYLAVPRADAILSATAGPHFTITAGALKALGPLPFQVYVDLAVPLDMEPEIARLPGVTYINMEDLKHMARENREKKKSSLEDALLMAKEGAREFEKHRMFQENFKQLQAVQEFLAGDIAARGTKKALAKFFYALREGGSPELLQELIPLLCQYGQISGKD